MKIPEQILKEWKEGYERNDLAMIHEQNKDVSKYKISLAFNYGKSDTRTFNAINSYFTKKKNAENKIINDSMPY